MLNESFINISYLLIQCQANTLQQLVYYNQTRPMHKGHDLEIQKFVKNYIKISRRVDSKITSEDKAIEDLIYEFENLFPCDNEFSYFKIVVKNNYVKLIKLLIFLQMNLFFL